MVNSRRKAALLALAACIVVASCARNVDLLPSGGVGQAAGGDQPSFSQFADIPILAGSTMDMDQTLIFGTGDTWTGRLVMNAPSGSVETFDFYQQKTPQFGWREISSVRAAVSILTYMRAGRVMTLQIRDNTLRGSRITAIVTPQKPDASLASPRLPPVRSAPALAPPPPRGAPYR